jgi:hypothetical protein
MVLCDVNGNVKCASGMPTAVVFSSSYTVEGTAQTTSRPGRGVQVSHGLQLVLLLWHLSRSPTNWPPAVDVPDGAPWLCTNDVPPRGCRCHSTVSSRQEILDAGHAVQGDTYRGRSSYLLGRARGVAQRLRASTSHPTTIARGRG